MLTGPRHRRAWVCLVLLSLASRSVAHTPNFQTTPAPDEEPITPIPQPPAADALKVALEERLFMDRRLSHLGVAAPDAAAGAQAQRNRPESVGCSWDRMPC